MPHEISSVVFNEDCMEVMKRYPDKHFDLAVVDPPYGIGEDGGKARTRGSKRTNGEKKGWDNQRPNAEYFAELLRVSKNQIIWGGNYFADLLPASRCWLYWQKNMGGDFADGELAWTSFDKVLKQYTKRSETFDRIHPTQKPVKLYDWIFNLFAICKHCDGLGWVWIGKHQLDCTKCNGIKPKILDTHLGSGSNRIAAHKAGLSFVGCEIDKEYYEAQEKRFKQYLSQLRLF